MKPRLTTGGAGSVSVDRGCRQPGGSDDRGKSRRSERDLEGSKIGNEEGMGMRKRMRGNELLRGVVKL
jgi:hypothetical protein